MSANDPVELTQHVAMLLSIAVPTASAVMAWAGVKFGLKGLVKDVADAKVDIEAIQKEIKCFVAKPDCQRMQTGCDHHISASNADITRRLDQLADIINKNEENRNLQKDIRNAAIADLAKQVAVLDRTIKLRAFAYRKGNGNNGHVYALDEKDEIR